MRIEIDPTPVLMRERATLSPHRRAFFHVLAQVPVGNGSLLSALRAYVEATRETDPEADAVIWFDNVFQIVRAHPDMDAFGAVLSAELGVPLEVVPGVLDALCRAGMAVDALAPPDDVATILAPVIAIFGGDT